MTTLRQRMLDALVQRYLLHLVQGRQLGRSSVNHYGCAFRFLYGTVLGLDGEAFQIPLAAAPQRLPEILSRAEIAVLLERAPHPKARAAFSCAYALGLRVSERCSQDRPLADAAGACASARVQRSRASRSMPRATVIAARARAQPRSPRSSRRTARARTNRAADPIGRIRRALDPRWARPPHGHAGSIALDSHAPSALALPNRATETYTAHATATPAVQSSEVYLTPCTARAFDCLHLGVR